jgi:hypothetical protein
VFDIGSCCDIISIAAFVDGRNRIREFAFAQFFPSISERFQSSNITDTLVTGRIKYEQFRDPVDEDFVLPHACTNPLSIVDYCETFYEPYGFCVDNTAVPLEIDIPNRRDQI